jgi:hypothetical protein
MSTSILSICSNLSSMHCIQSSSPSFSMAFPFFCDEEVMCRVGVVLKKQSGARLMQPWHLSELE